MKIIDHVLSHFHPMGSMLFRALKCLVLLVGRRLRVSWFLDLEPNSSLLTPTMALKMPTPFHLSVDPFRGTRRNLLAYLPMDIECALEHIWKQSKGLDIFQIETGSSKYGMCDEASGSLPSSTKVTLSLERYYLPMVPSSLLLLFIIFASGMYQLES